MGVAWRTHKTLPLDDRQPTVRVLITGSRTWPLTWHVEDALGFYWELGGMLTVVHGDCPNGPDRYARDWCERMNSGVMGQVVTEERHPANWEHGNGAGFWRNVQMVHRGADVCLAFMDVCRKPDCRRHHRQPHPSHGTWHCATRAKDCGIEVVRYQTWEPADE